MADDLPAATRALTATTALLRWCGITRAVAFGTLSKVWAMVAGPVTMLLIASRFSQETQGYYYTFASVLSLSVLVELGLGTVVQQFASHEWAALRLDARGVPVGDDEARARLANLARSAFRWYAVAALVVAGGVSALGFVFFGQQDASDVIWRSPWLLLCVATGISMLLVPAWSLLDGCGQMSFTNAARLASGVAGSVLGWLAVLAGAGLYASFLVSLTTTLVTVVAMYRGFGAFFVSLLRYPVAPRSFSWADELWPMQWRTAVSSLGGYLVSAVVTPVLFHFHGPAVAGQMGMTLQLSNALLLLAFTWVGTRVPQFAVLVARREYEALDALFRRSAVQSLALGTSSALIVWTGLVVAHDRGVALAARVLDPLPAALLLVAMLANLAVAILGAYLRAHRREPLLPLSLLTGTLIAVSVIVLSRRWAALGAVAGQAVVNLLMLVPNVVVFLRCRAAWHAPSPR